MTKAEGSPRTEKGFDLLPEAEPMAVQDIRDALVIREGEVFLLTDTAGNVARGNPSGHGLYHRDTRYLSGFEFTFSTAKPILLLSTAALGYGSEHVFTNASMVDAEGQRIPRGSVQVTRGRVIHEGLEETLTVVNYNPFPVSLELTYRLAADFADIFEVRGYEPEQRGHPREPRWENGLLVLEYKGRDGHTRQSLVRFEPPPEAQIADTDLGVAVYRARLAPQETRSFRLVVSLDGELPVLHGDATLRHVAGEYERWLRGCTHVYSDSDFFNAVISRSLHDLRTLWNESPGGSYPAAGTPWYDTLFGRDSCIVGMQTLAFNPEIARHCLGSLARWQGKKFDAWRDEEPGKIPHELRRGELTQVGELPFSPYYGSIDSTPLFLMLAAEYYRWTGDRELIEALRPNIDAAVHWMEKYGDTRGTGYIAYEKRSMKGLVNQGWKDSSDSMVHRDGRLVDAPVALVEVQAYAYAALRGLAGVYAALGAKDHAGEYEKRAAELRERFNRDFWAEDEGCYALALDGDGHPAASVTSDAGHALWGGIATKDYAARTAARLMEPDMFSGWGIRTLSTQSPRFNPQGYHVGSVWPHDNSIVAMGFKRYGFERELNTLASALFDAARMFEYQRLPELFGGDRLSPYQTPVPYPVACRPQAWAAGTFLLITQAMLGLCPDAPARKLYIVRPRLPEFVNGCVRVKGLRVGAAEVDLRYELRGDITHAEVEDVRGELTVEMAEAWPEA